MDILQEIKAKILTAKNREDLVLWGKLYGLICWSNQTTPRADTVLEREIYAKYVSLFGLPLPPCDTIQRKPNALHIATQVSSTGGHTALLAATAKNLQIRSDLLLTAQATPYPSGRLADCFSDVQTLPPQRRSDAVQRIAEAIEPYNLIFLHIHPNDIETSLACLHVKQHDRGKRIFLVNHADHVFSFGYAAADCVLEISAYGWQLHEERGITSACFVGIPIGHAAGPTPSHSPSGCAATVVSAGSSEKYRPNRSGSFPRIAKKLLQTNESATLLLIGPHILTDYWWWPCKLRFPRRCRFAGPMPHDQYIRTIASADLFIDSIPLTGGSALPEAYSLGIPVMGLRTGIYGYSALDLVKAGSEAELVSAARHALSAPPPPRDQRVAELFEEVHSPGNFRRRINGAVFDGQRTAPPAPMLRSEVTDNTLKTLINLGGWELVQLVSQAQLRWLARASVLLVRCCHVPRVKDIIAFTLGVFRMLLRPRRPSFAKD